MRQCFTVTDEYTGDPAFAADGFHLTCASVAIDTGVNTGVDDDIPLQLDDTRRTGHIGYGCECWRHRH